MREDGLTLQQLYDLAKEYLMADAKKQEPQCEMCGGMKNEPLDIIVGDLSSRCVDWFHLSAVTLSFCAEELRERAKQERAGVLNPFGVLNAMADRFQEMADD